MRAPALAACLLAALPACSSESPAATTGDPSPTGPEGAVNMEVYATPDQACPPGNFHIDIGNTKVSPPELVVDGAESASVTCAVVPSGTTKLAASGALKKSGLDFSFQDVLTDGTSATGKVSFVDPKTGVRYTSSDAKPCVFQFAPGTGQGISSGNIWVQFDCSNLVSEADAASACSSRYGYVVLDRCTSK